MCFLQQDNHKTIPIIMPVEVIPQGSKLAHFQVQLEVVPPGHIPFLWDINNPCQLFVDEVSIKKSCHFYSSAAMKL
jgi:hypothetical protein